VNEIEMRAHVRPNGRPTLTAVKAALNETERAALATYDAAEAVLTCPWWRPFENRRRVRAMRSLRDEMRRAERHSQALVRAYRRPS
jgi:hypothetical protein